MIFDFKQYNERVNIVKKGKKLLTDDKPLKELKFEQVSGNICAYIEQHGNFLFPKGKIYLYLFDSHEWSNKMAKGEVDLLMFPHRRRFDLHSSPIDDIWKKSRAKNLKGVEHIIGAVEGQLYEPSEEDPEKIVMIQMMSVRPGFKGNRVNSFMVDSLQERFGNEYKLAFEDPTADGLEFIAKYKPDSIIYWTHRHRPKNWDPAKFPNVKDFSQNS